MGIVDTFSREDRVQVKFTDFYNLIYEAAKSELICNGIKNNVPNEYMLGIINGREILIDNRTMDEVI